MKRETIYDSEVLNLLHLLLAVFFTITYLPHIVTYIEEGEEEDGENKRTCFQDGNHSRLMNGIKFPVICGPSCTTDCYRPRIREDDDALQPAAII